MRSYAAVLLIISSIPLAALAQQKAAAPLKSAGATATYQDIQQTLGLVPGFMRLYPAEGIASAWDHFKSSQLTPGAIPPKYKELTGLAVASQIPCTYCVYAHTQFAKANGATDAEVREAIAIAALTRGWSTYLQGLAIDEAQFASDVRAMFKDGATGGSGAAGSGQPKSAPQLSMEPVTTAEQAQAEMQRSFGVVPTFMKRLPPAASVALWNSTKQFEMAQTAIPAKYKSLIGLGVSAQVPCAYCVAFEQQNGRANGVTEQEKGEALMMAANTRIWSTVLNGNSVDEAQFKRDIDQLVKNAQHKARKGTGGSGETPTK